MNADGLALGYLPVVCVCNFVVIELKSDASIKVEQNAFGIARKGPPIGGWPDRNLSGPVGSPGEQK